MEIRERLRRTFGAWPLLVTLVWSLLNIADTVLFGASVMPSIGQFLLSPIGNLTIALTAIAILVIVIIWPEITKRVPRFTTIKDKKLNLLESRISLIETIIKPFVSQEDVKTYKKKIDNLSNRVAQCEKHIESMKN